MLLNIPLILIAIFVIALSFFLKYLVKVVRVNLAIKWIPSPPEVPILGNLNLFKNNKETIKVLLKISEEHKNIFKLRLGPIDSRVFITDVNLLQYFMSSNKFIDKSNFYMYLHNWLNFGLLTSTGDKWQKRRKLITPTFHFKILEQFIEIFDSTSDILVKRLKDHDDKNAFDIYPYITLCTLDIICESAMGIKVNAQIERDATYVKSIRNIADVVTRRIISPTKMYSFFYFFSLDHLNEKFYLKTLHGMTDSVIKSRRLEISKNNNKNQPINEDDIGKKKRSPFLDTLIHSTIDGKPLTDEDIREEVDTFMFEGHDTTSSGICFTLYCLSKYQDVQDKVVEELNNIFGEDKNRQTTYNDLQEMKYLEMVIKESLRLFPPVPIVGRALNEDVTVDGKFFPANTDISFFIIGVHRNPDIYPDPLKFDPERFDVNKQTNRHPFAFIPFSAGPRNCIGQKYAMLELKSTISKVLRNYRLLPAENFEVDIMNELVLKSNNGIKMKIKAR